jgi:hypothetical protein
MIMQGTKIFAVCCCMMMLVVMALEAQAASARVRCRVRGDRVRVKVDGQGLEPGIYTARVKNLDTGAVAKTAEGQEAEATEQVADVDLDFDSKTDDEADDQSFIRDDFAEPGHRVRALVRHDAGGTVARATAVCQN